MSFTSWQGRNFMYLKCLVQIILKAKVGLRFLHWLVVLKEVTWLFTVPTTGTYYVKLRSYYGMETGTASLVVYAGSGSTPSYYYLSCYWLVELWS